MYMYFHNNNSYLRLKPNKQVGILTLQQAFQSISSSSDSDAPSRTSVVIQEFIFRKKWLIGDTHLRYLTPATSIQERHQCKQNNSIKCNSTLCNHAATHLSESKCCCYSDERSQPITITVRVWLRTFLRIFLLVPFTLVSNFHINIYFYIYIYICLW